MERTGIYRDIDEKEGVLTSEQLLVQSAPNTCSDCQIPREIIEQSHKVVVILSGGMDSTTLLYDVLNEGYDVYAVSFDYGQRHGKEIWAAMKTCELLGIPYKIVALNALCDVAPSALTRKEISVPDGKYDEPSMKQTVVPNRNMVMLALAISYAIGIGANRVFYGAHAGDHAIYPDCRPEFVQSLAAAAQLCDWYPIEVLAPYLDMDKGDIALRGKELGVDYALTWSCYKGEEHPCGTCGACTERAEAFLKAGMLDPLLKVN